VLVAGHERDAAQQLGQVDRVVEHLVEQRLVGAPHHGDGGDGPALGRGQVGQDLLVEEVGDALAGAEGPQLGERRPPGQPLQPVERDTPQRGERGQLVVGERQVAFADAGHAALGVEPGQRDRRLVPPGQHQVPVRGQRLDQLAQQAGGGRPAGDLVGVVDHQAHPPGRAGPHAGGDGRGQLGGLRAAGLALGQLDVEPGGQALGQRPGVGVGGAAAQPAVLAPGGERVLVERLGEQRALAEPGAGGEDRDPVVPPAVQAVEQHAALEQGTAGARRREAVGTWHGARRRLRRRAQSRGARAHVDSCSPPAWLGAHSPDRPPALTLG
jgi:hypothetical protein